MDRPAPSPLVRSFERHLRAANRSANTVAGYVESARQAEAFLATRGRDLRSATRADLGDFLADPLARRSASAAATRHKGLRILYHWLAEEDEVTRNPMARIRAPAVVQPIRMLRGPARPGQGLDEVGADRAGLIKRRFLDPG